MAAEQPGVTRDDVARWVAAYEVAWRAPGTDALAGIFTPDASYLQGPYEEPVCGLPAIGRMWEAEREGPHESFQMASEIVAVDGDTAVVRVQVRYGNPVTEQWRNLWLVLFAPAGRLPWRHRDRRTTSDCGAGAAVRQRPAHHDHERSPGLGRA